jgi:hypothetical protein
MHALRATALVQPLETTLSIGNDLMPQADRHVDQIIGVLMAGRTALADATVYLASRTEGGTFALTGMGTTDIDGIASFSVTPAQPTQYELIFRGDEVYQSSRSPVMTLKAIGT